MTRRKPALRYGFSLMEIMVAVSIVGLMAAMASQQYFGSMAKARENTCRMQKGEIEIQVQRFHRRFNRWPSPTLNDIRRMPEYFPDGVEQCPVDETSYRLDPKTHQVVGHKH